MITLNYLNILAKQLATVCVHCCQKGQKLLVDDYHVMSYISSTSSGQTTTVIEMILNPTKFMFNCRTYARTAMGIFVPTTIV